MNRRNLILLSVLVVTALVVAVLSGPRFINPFSMEADEQRILYLLRLPRATVAFLMGAALGASGAVLQGVFRNPLADPYVLGISSGASLAAALGLMAATTLPLPVPLLAFLGALVTCIAVAALGSSPQGLRPDRLLLGGIGLGFFFSALLMLAMTISRDDGLKRAILWLSGDLSNAGWHLLPAGALLIAGGLALALWRGKGLNALTLGDEIAHGLGFTPSKERLLLFVAASLMTAAAISLGGIVGFIGMLVPHAVRRLLGADARIVLPGSALAGGALLCLADSVGRTLAAPLEIPAGIIAALIGAPLFLFLLRKKGYGL
ncbi:FecCD family ABC transporter permease [Geoalkalibacter sp.]|uniref:FecCD family ABC transporter permease n=1 Tax=Geoalkalibacter sp. TaxID=3041440 RepID=UPI00272E5E5F|nr:iron ABC transporter permease [Geoalkalibacter sp.]